MEEEIKAKLNTKLLKKTGGGGGGCINTGECYETDHGLIFVKRNSKAEASRMFEGELEGLKAMQASKTVRVPNPLQVLDDPNGGAVLLMEYLTMTSLSRYAAKLGQQLAEMHLCNQRLQTESEKRKAHVGEEADMNSVNKFGFHCTTCCGYIPQDNTWCDDWVEFFTRQKLQMQINLIQENHGDRDLKDLWPLLQQKIPALFNDIHVQPSLLHGDLWGGNAAENSEGPIIFDAASFYGHSEYDLAIAKMFGGFGNSFFTAYHEVIPKEPGFDKRLQLYQLFHYLNHWNHFGSGYKSSSISIMRKLIK